MIKKKQDIQKKDLRNFSFLIAGAITVWWLYTALFKNKTLSLSPLFIALALALVGVGAPQVLYYPYRIWMWFGEKVGVVMSRIVLTVFFFILLTPIALLRRVFSRDPLGMQLHKESATYFNTKIIQKSSQFERMF